MASTTNTIASGIPPPSLNGGLYTGEPFLANAPWRNFPARPDTVNLITVNLSSANPPPGVTTQFPGGHTRPGNHTLNIPRATYFSPEHAMVCTPCAEPAPQQTSGGSRFARFAYL